MSSGMPRVSSDCRVERRLSSRSTTDSPNCVGIVDMRTSIFWSRAMTAIRPSCGMRFSAMSRPAISFSRSASAGAIFGSPCVCGISSPSMRKRICRRPSCGSTCTSEAFTCTASSNTDWSSLTTGASSAPAPRPSVPKSM